MAEVFDSTKYKRGFWALIATQFQGAFSDNLFKMVLVFFFLDAAAGTSGELSSAEIAAYAGMLFSLPYIIFPSIFGALADRYSKQKITVATKVLEVVIMALGGLALLSANPVFLWGILFLMASQSALFSPAKYGILPEMLPDSRLSWGNGVIQMGTMAAIISGAASAGYLYELLDSRGQLPFVSFLLVCLALGGIVTAWQVSRPAAANPSQRIPLNPYSGMGVHFKFFWADRWMLLTVAGYMYFWFAAALIQGNLIPFGADTLGLNEGQMGLTQAAVALGIGAGAVVAGYLSRGKIEVGLVPLGALGMTLFSGLLAFDVFGFTACLVLLFGLGFFGGVFDVPLAATIQQRSPAHMRGGILATVNMLTFVGIFSASALMWVFGQINVGPRGVFLFCGILTLALGVYLCFLLPIFIVRLVLWVLANTLYRVRVLGRSNIPDSGGALLVANHTSFLDALVILASMDRRVRFIMYQGIYEVPWIKPLAKMMGVIPVSPDGGPREVIQSLRTATDAIRAGDLVCIFAEGQITRTGQMLPFRRGFERIMKGVDAPIIPVHIDQIWGSIFSFSKGRFFWKWPTSIPFPITIGFGAPMSSDANAFELRSAIQELGTEAYGTRVANEPLLHQEFIRRARRHPFMLGVADARTGSLSYLKTLTGSIVLGKKLKKLLGPEEMIGVLLPQSVGSALVNIALTMMGKIPVNLNYTASEEALESSARQCGMKQVITAKAFLEIVPIPVPGDPIYLEDIMGSVSTKDRVIGMLYAIFCPTRLIEKRLGSPPKRSADDLATVVFSSGSEGEPKGVMLSHHNIMSNIRAGLQVFPHNEGDVVVGMLPFFHSFGYTATLWLVLIGNLSAVYHPNPTEARAIGKLIQQYEARILFSTSTFLHAFIRRCTPTQLSSLNHIVAGAEKLAPRVRDAFKEKFGIEPLEGYGTTECAPIVSMNVPDFRAPGFFQKGTRRGSIGHPLPGISVRIIETDTGEPLQNGEAGLLLVKGPNVMKGYLGQPEKTDAVLKDGWYTTGDIANIDEDGFITITDRLARFSKIAGEMVSHTKVEEALHGILDESETLLAVASVPDESKGERLVVLHTLSDDQFELLMSKLDETGLPNLWVPRAKAYYRIDEIPVLGTGKMDIKAVKNMARRLDIGE